MTMINMLWLPTKKQCAKKTKDGFMTVRHAGRSVCVFSSAPFITENDAAFIGYTTMTP
jgi:Trk-type K+ transport system membrane component